MEQEGDEIAKALGARAIDNQPRLAIAGNEARMREQAEMIGHRILGNAKLASDLTSRQSVWFSGQQETGSRKSSRLSE